MKLNFLFFITSCILLFQHRFGYGVKLKMSQSIRSQRDHIEEIDFSTKNIVNTIYFSQGAHGLTSSSVKSSSKILSFSTALSVQKLKVRIIELLTSTFLPTGYPQSVPPDYLKFQAWYLIQDMCSYFRAIMSTKALLQGLGVGRAEMTAVQATLHWVMKDGASMIGGLLFTTFSSTNFGQNAKSWRLFADYIFNVGITLDLIAPMNQAFFLYFICLSSVCKSLCGVAAGATGSVISEHWGQWHGNVAEVNSKNKAQSMVVSLLCLIVSIPFTRFIDRQSALVVGGVYSVLTAIHSVVSYLCVRSLQLRSVNVARGTLLVKHFLDTVSGSLTQSVQSVGQTTTNIAAFTPAQLHIISVDAAAQAPLFTPSHIASIEPIIFFPTAPVTKFRGKFGTKIPFNDGVIHLFASPSEVHQYLSMTGHKNVTNLFDSMGGENKYVILSDTIPGEYSLKEVFVCFSESASSTDQVKALFEACLLLKSTVLSSSRELVNQLFELFQVRLLEGRWDLNRVMLRPKDVRVFAGNNFISSSAIQDSVSKKAD